MYSLHIKNMLLIQLPALFSGSGWSDMAENSQSRLNLSISMLPVFIITQPRNNCTSGIVGVISCWGVQINKSLCARPHWLRYSCLHPFDYVCDKRLTIDIAQHSTCTVSCTFVCLLACNYPLKDT